ncbi:MAG: hypothetical protein AAGI63_04595 [Planctomycetota bacterium]
MQLAPSLLSTLLLLPVCLGCSIYPETRQRERLHNPFPQLKKIAILPFFNQSNEPTLDTDLVTQQYYAELQAIPGFEVMPVGVSRMLYMQHALQYGEPTDGETFQALARSMGVEAVVVGSVTDFDAYYPPRLAMTVNWYAANEGFHPIPAGYGLPWGTESEKDIPKRIVHDAEFELARSQLATQTPISTGAVPQREMSPMGEKPPMGGSPPEDDSDLTPVGYTEQLSESMTADSVIASDIPGEQMTINDQFHGDPWMVDMAAPLPADWPDATDLIPDPPMPHRPQAIINRDPILTHTKIYHGDDPYFTSRLANRIETGDDARPGGWQGYLRRSDDFIRFCCHLHISELLESRGGADQSDLILQWPLSRY